MFEAHDLKEDCVASAPFPEPSVVFWLVSRRPAERRSLACLVDRHSCPKSSPARVPETEAKMICERRERTGRSPRRLADEPDVAVAPCVKRA